MLNNVSGLLAEYQLAYDFRARRSFALSVYFDGVKDKTELKIRDVRIRPTFKRDIERKMEFDLLAEVKNEPVKWETSLTPGLVFFIFVAIQN